MLVSIADRRIEGPEEVTRAINFNHSYNKTPSGENSKYDVLFGALFECRFLEWIRGGDIVDHPLVRQVISAERLEHMKGNPNARAELLLDGVSTTHIPPLTQMSIMVCVAFTLKLLV